ncbi:MAG: flavodoxin family protein [Thermaerobacter sp.]|nr:flavodoxin family protein [Thermaerobacter sp.]
MAMKKVLGLCGSARRDGNTDLLIREILRGAADTGAAVETIRLSDLSISPCTGCNHCKTHDECSIPDDMSMLLDEIVQSSGVVLGSPVYMGQATGQTKVFLDRLYQLRRGDRTLRVDGSHIRGAVVAVCGAPSHEHPQATLATLRVLFRCLNQPKVWELVGTSLGPKGIVRERTGLLEDAYELGRKLGS